MTSPLKILLTNSSDIYAGGEFYVLELAGALRSRGHQVWVACKPDNLLRVKCEKSDIPVIPLEFPPRGHLLKFVVELRGIIKRQGIQIVHTNSNYDRTAGACAARITGTAHVANVHSFHSLQHNITHWLRNNFATDHFIVDGMCVKDLLVRDDRLPPGKISVVYLGVRPEEMKRDDELRNKIRGEFEYSNDRIVIGNVARLVPFKGQEYLLKAFAEVRTHVPEVRLLLIGDGELLEKLKTLAQNLHIEEYVTFAGFRDDLQAVYSALDIYVHSSVEGGGETFPFAVLQALAQSLPVVVTRVGDVPVMVDDGLNGYVVPDVDASALAQKLILLASDRALRESMGRESRRKLVNSFTLDAMVNAVEKIYFAVTSK